jgi:hypothetical protein
MAYASITDLATPKFVPWFLGDHRVLQNFDLSIVEGDVVEGLCSDCGDDQLSNSSHLTSGSTSSSHSHRNCNETNAYDFAISGHVILVYAI